MNLRTVVKVGNISNLSDARYCAGFGVDMIGFNLDSGDDEHISVNTAKEIMGWIAGTEFMLEYGSTSIEEIEKTSVQLSINNYQVDDIDVANNLASKGNTVCFKYAIHNQDDLAELGPTVGSLSSEITYILIESHVDKLTEAINISLDSIDSSIKLLKSYAIDQSTILNEIANRNFHGVALKGSQEEKPGFKDYDELADILELLEVD